MKEKGRLMQEKKELMGKSPLESVIDELGLDRDKMVEWKKEIIKTRRKRVLINLILIFICGVILLLAGYGVSKLIFK